MFLREIFCKDVLCEISPIIRVRILEVLLSSWILCCNYLPCIVYTHCSCMGLESAVQIFHDVHLLYEFGLQSLPSLGLQSLPSLNLRPLPGLGLWLQLEWGSTCKRYFNAQINALLSVVEIMNALRMRTFTLSWNVYL